MRAHQRADAGHALVLLPEDALRVDLLARVLQRGMVKARRRDHLLDRHCLPGQLRRPEAVREVKRAEVVHVLLAAGRHHEHLVQARQVFGERAHLTGKADGDDHVSACVLSLSSPLIAKQPAKSATALSRSGGGVSRAYIRPGWSRRLFSRTHWRQRRRKFRAPTVSARKNDDALIRHMWLKIGFGATATSHVPGGSAGSRRIVVSMSR